MCEIIEKIDQVNVTKQWYIIIMLKDTTLIACVKKNIEVIVMNNMNITKYLDLYNYNIDCYETMNEYILDNYNYELFGKDEKWAQLETIGVKEIQHFIPNILIMSYSYNNYYEVIKWIIKEEYYKLMSFYALGISYKIIRNNISASVAIIAGGAGSVTMSIMNGNNPLSSVSYSTPNSNIEAKTSTTQYFNTSDSYWIRVINNTNSTISVQPFIFPASQTRFTIQTYTASIQAGKPYWATGSTGNLVLSSSYDIGKAYQYYSQVPFTGSGFDTPQPLNILPYDEIRFDGNEATVATIISSSFDNSNLDEPVLYLHLQAPFAFDSVDINYFAIRRWVPSIDNIIINTPGTVMGSGFIFPKYPSPLLKENLPSIIENLTNKGLV